MSVSGSDLPPELFPFILKYVGTDDRGGYLKKDGRRYLRTCSLVCIDWANRCRDHLFRHRTLEIKTLRELATLEGSFTSRASGHTRLRPLIALVDNVVFKWEQNWDSPSWCHRAYSSPLAFIRKQGCKLDLTLRGPVPANLPRAAYRSPHWSLPRSMPYNFLLLLNVNVCDVRFPALSDLYQLCGHFASTPSLDMRNVSWGVADVPAGFLRRRNTNRYIMKQQIRRFAATGCTDNVLPCLLAFQRLVPSSASPFTYMDERQLDACIVLFKAATGIDGDGTGRAECKEGFEIRHGREYALASYFSASL